MEESDDNMSAEDIACHGSLLVVRTKSKKRSLVERELETNLTARITSPLSVVDATSTSRYGRARRLKTDSEFITDPEKVTAGILGSPSFEKTPVKIQSPVYKMHASNSPKKPDSSKCTPKRVSLESNLDNQIESIYHENISLSRFGSDEKKSLSPNKPPKVYVRKDLIQKRYQDDTTLLMKNMFSPVKSSQKSKSHLSNILERSSEKYSLNLGHSKSQNGLSSVVKALDFDNKKKKKENRDIKAVKSKSDLFDVEAKCEYQVGDLAWARMGTYPFWPCIVTREPQSELFVKKKLFGRIEHDIVHVTFFGDNGRRSWIVDNMLRKFLGQLEFEATREKFTSADKKRDPRFYAAFFISEKKQPQWNVSVEEAEMLLREPKRLRIDALYDIIHKARMVKTTPKEHKSGKITRTASDVSLSESLYDTLFSEDDGKAEDVDRTRNKTRNKSLDVSEVVTACLDNMAAKTGITKIQRQSHMDRWLQKAKSKTPEKTQAKAQALLKKVEKEIKTSNSKKKKRTSPKAVMSHKPYSFRKYANESRKSLPHYFDYGTNFEPDLSSTLNGEDNNGSLNNVESIEELQSGIGIISKVESLSNSINSKMKYEETSKIVDIIQDRIIDENNTEHNKNVDFLSENIKTDKGNVIYDIQIEVDASSVQEEQIKKYDAMFIHRKLARHLSDDTMNDGIESQENTGKNDSDSDVLKMNECISKESTEMVHQTKSREQEQIINNAPLTSLNMENCTTGIKVSDNMEMSFNKDTEANRIYLSDEESNMELKFDDTTEEDHQTKLIDKPEQVINNELHIEPAIEERNLEESMTQVNTNDNIEIPFDEDMKDNEISINVEKRIGKVKINDSIEEDHNTMLIQKQKHSINSEPHLKPDVEKSTTEVKANENTDKVVDEVMGVNEPFLNEKKTAADVDINDSIKEIHIINKPQPDSHLDDSTAEVNVKDSTIMLIDSYIKPGDISYLEKNSVMEAELKDNTELSIVENIQSDKIITDDCDSIVHSIDAIIEDNPHNTILTEDYCDRLDSTKTHQSEVSEEDSERSCDGIDEQGVRKTSSKQISVKSVTEKAEKAKCETVSDAYRCVPSNIREDSTVPSSDVIDCQNVPTSCENISFTSVTANVPVAETGILHNLDHNVQSELCECIGENNGHSFDGKNVQAESSHKEEFKTTEQECFIRLNNICDQEDKHLTQNGKNVSKSALVTESEPAINSLCDSIKFDDLCRNELNKRSDLKLANMKMTEDIRKTSVHYVTFAKSKEAEDDDDLFAHLPEIKLVVPEVSENNDMSADIKLNSGILDTAENACKAIENGTEDSNSKDKATNEINNDKNRLQIDKIVSTKTDQILSQINLDKHANMDSLNSDLVPINSNALDSSIHSSSISVMVNGFHTPKDLEDFEGETSSINSEDIEPLSVTRKKILQEKSKPKLDDPEFVTYLEIRQDDMIADHPELNENQIVEYLYETWMYEKNLKSDTRKNDIQQLNLLMGLEPKQEPNRKRSSREKKRVTKEKKKRNVADNSDFDTVSIKSSDSGTSMKRWLRPKKSALYNEIFFDDSRGTTPDKIKDEIDIDSASLCSIESELSNQMPKIEVELVPVNSSTENLAESKTDAVSGDEKNVEPQPNSINSTTHSLSNKLCNLQENDVADKKIKSEFDLETTSIATASSEISASKPKQKLKCVDTNGFSLDDPEFLKYLELRQDTLTDENPQLTHEEIVRYLYQTWLYDESGKSDMIKSYEIEQSNLVKGLKPDQDVQRKKIKKKIKVEKDLKDFVVDDSVIIKDKPKRKIAQGNCYKEDFSDVEDEIEIFEIMKGVSIPRVQLTKLPEQGTSYGDNTVIEIVDEVDEIEKYFEELVKPKPNLFKGLIREKVCEICERTGNLVKCRGCNSMFHIACVKKETIAVEPVPLPARGRKKKKRKTCRKSKDDSESQSDEKSQDVSAEFDMKVEPQPHTVDAENFEALLEAKMKELLESNTEIHYDSYSSDDGIDWSETVAGKCEIVDVKLKPKILNNDYSDFKCNNCTKHDVPVCFVCKLVISKTGVKHKQRCQVAHCHKYYHLECLDHWPQTQFTSGDRDKKTNEIFENLMCPRHVCHTCVSDDPRGCNTRFSGDKLARCVRCPATYHTFTKCIPAGTEILTGSHIVCPRHYDHRPGKVPCHVNTGWCFICAVGGTLICCEYCPTSFHAECLNIKPPEGSYMCEDCETGRLPLYGEMVWVKLGHYRWWPGIILHPSEIPDNLLAVKHSPGEFVVRFFGQYDHYWVNRGRVFPFQEGDSGRISSNKSKINADFTTAMEHAARACDILKAAPPNEEESLDIASSLLPPHYVKLKVNKPCGSLCGRRVDIEESSLTQCECNPEEEDPCGPYSQCLNRMLLTECGPICRAGDRCNNRAFEKRLYPKMVPYRTHYRGWGLKTLEDIKAGQFVIEYVGELIDEEEFRRRMNRKHEIRDENFYFLTLDKERMIDAGPKGNLARFMNHCCEPNCETQKWTVLGDVRVGLFAIHDIPANSEVTFNYNLECAGIDKKRCLCGAKRCPGYIGAKPKQDESQPKKPKFAAKRTYKKRKNTEESPSTKNKPKRPVGRPAKPRELTEIEKDLLIIKNATNCISSDSDCSRLSSVDGEKNQKALKRKRVSFSTEESVVLSSGKSSPSVKKRKLDKDKSESVL